MQYGSTAWWVANYVICMLHTLWLADRCQNSMFVLEVSSAYFRYLPGYRYIQNQVFPPRVNSSYTFIYKVVTNHWCSILLIKVPTWGSSSTAKSSPALMNCLGFLAAPTPGGVPVRIMVPARKVVPWVRKAMSWGTVKIKSLSFMVSG